MKNVTKEEVKKSKKIAFSYLYGWKNLKWDSKPKLDMRYRVSKLAISYFNLYQLSEPEKQEVKTKRRHRNINHPYGYINYLNNPLLVDFLKNRNYTVKVYQDRIAFSGRNHWAKNQTDMKVLTVIKKMI